MDEPQPTPAGIELDATPTNQGVISNVLVVADGSRTWLVGSGPDRAWATQLGCVIRRDLRRRVTDVIAPWPRPELVLGATAFPGARYWAHAQVAERMKERCPHCAARLDERLGRPTRTASAVRRSLRIPDHRVSGTEGTLGPWHWQRLWRSTSAPSAIPTTSPNDNDTTSTPVTVWSLPTQGIATAHGLLWGWGAPDARDATVTDLLASTRHLAQRKDVTLWIPEQGPVLTPGAVTLHVRYWEALTAAINTAQESGALETTVQTDLPGLSTSIGLSARHALNWQRAWRELEMR